MNLFESPAEYTKNVLRDFFFSPSVLILFVVLVLGCGTSSPRFKGSGSSRSENQRTDEPRFAAKVRQEETAEDDQKVNISEVRERYSASNPSPSERISVIDRKKVMGEILSLIGTPYALGGSGEDGMDCSAFTGHIYGKAVNRSLPRSTVNQYRIGKSVGNSRLKFGDLVFFNTTGQSPSHVGIFIGDDLFAHASVSWGVTISSLQSSYYRKRYIGARRVMD